VLRADEHEDGRVRSREGAEVPAPQQTEAAPGIRVPQTAPTQASVLALQASAGNHAVSSMLARWPGMWAPPAPAPAPARAPAGEEEQGPDYAAQLKAGDTPERAIQDLERSTVDFSRANRRWLSANWIEYIRHTSGNPRLSWTGDVVDGAVSNTLGNAVSDGAKFVAKRALSKGGAAATGAAVGGAIGNVPGAIIGFVVGVVIETAVGLIYDAIMGSSEERAASEASRRTGLLIENQEKALQKIEGSGIDAGRTKVDELRKRHATVGEDPAEQVKFRRGIRFEAHELGRNLPQDTNLSLAKDMLREWVMEHAGDEEDANDQTSEPEWEAARTRAFGKGDSLDNHPQIFAFQTRGHFRDIGLDITQAQSLAAEADRDWAKGADWMMKQHDGRKFTFTGAKDPEALIGFFADRHHKLSADGKAAIREGRFTLECVLDLDDADGAVYVDEWEYKITFRGGDGSTRWQDRASPPHAKQNPFDFTYSPD
jgi:hypothetical protein